MIISEECIKAINYITKIYSCFKSPDDVIRGMLRDFARNTDNDVIIDMLKTKTCKKIVLVYADKLEESIDLLMKDIDSYYRSIAHLINIIDLSKLSEENQDEELQNLMEVEE